MLKHTSTYLKLWEGSRERTQWIKPNLKIALIYVLVRSFIQNG